MKKITTLLLIAAAVFTMSCNNEVKEVETVKEEVKAATSALESKNYIVSNTESVVTWTGDKKIGDSHTGTINVAAGKFMVDNGVITAGKLLIDMTSISSTDLEGEDKANLDGHLKSEDFFNVAAFPSADLEIIDASDMANVEAKLTIKGKTQEIMFPMTVTVNEGVATVSSELEFDRTKFDITYGSGNFFEGLGDKIINDMVKMNVKLMAK